VVSSAELVNVFIEAIEISIFEYLRSYKVKKCIRKQEVALQEVLR
jgi:hypothetical protein